MPLGSALADDDVPGHHLLTTELLDSAILRVAIASVARRAYTFLMSHYFSPPLFLPKAISLMRTSVKACRWPCFFASFLRRFCLKTTIFSPSPCLTISPVTCAPLSAGVPPWRLLPSEARLTSPQVTLDPAS